MLLLLYLDVVLQVIGLMLEYFECVADQHLQGLGLLVSQEPLHPGLCTDIPPLQ